MSDVSVQSRWTGLEAEVQTTRAAIGISMLAGTEDGRGVGWEGISWHRLHRIAGRLAIQVLLFWLTRPWRLRVLDLWLKLVRGSKVERGDGQKVTVIPSGSFSPPWSPQVLPVQVARIGSLGIVAVPFELTTMAGRRLRGDVLAALQPAGVKRVVIAGLANAYAGYVATAEEYARQDYEGASTHFGPWTLAALQQVCVRLADALVAGDSTPSAASPAEPAAWLPDLQPRVLLDAAPPGRRLGELRRDAVDTYKRGDRVAVSIWSGHPKNNLRTQGTFLDVERLADGGWRSVATDGDAETRFIWRRWPCFGFPFSTASVEWRVPATAQPGRYRVRIHGEGKPLIGKPRTYTALSREFDVS
jgi:neutral ceramidase